MHPDFILSPAEDTPLLKGVSGNNMYIYVVSILGALGGFLFGYDTGIISGTMLFVRDVFDLNEWWQEAIVSSTLLTAFASSMCSGSIADRFGRRPVILLSSVVFAAGSVILALAWNKYILLVGRLVVGAGVGFASVTVPMYIAEVAPAKIRGQLVLINMCCITGGQFFASLLAYLFSQLHGSDGWRFMLGFAAIPAAIQFVAFLFMPESPRWLIKMKRYNDGLKVLKAIRPLDYPVQTEFQIIKDSSIKTQNEQDLKDPNTSTFQRILANPAALKALFIGCMLQLTQQLSGINTVMYYSASIIEMSGVYDKSKALLLSAATAGVNFVFTILGGLLVERIGRRKLTLFSLFGVIMSLIVLAAGFQFAYYNSPLITEHLNTTIVNNSPCDSDTILSCSDCSKYTECGFCFVQQPGPIQASCLRVNPNHHDRSTVSNCSQGTDIANNQIWAYEWCPSNYSWLIVSGLMLYLMFFAPGMGPMPWTINAEIFPSWAKSWSISAATSVNWMSNLVISMTFLSLTSAITKQGAFYLYSAFATVGFITFVILLPETKGKSLEQLEVLFEPKKRQGSMDESGSHNESDSTSHE